MSIKIKMKYCFTGQLKVLIEKAEMSTTKDVHYIMSHLIIESNLAVTGFFDFALVIVANSIGYDRIKFYLFKGTLKQKKYASLNCNQLRE